MLNVDRQSKIAPKRGWWLNDPFSDRLAFGIVLHKIDGRWLIARTLIGSPAEKVGVLKGEELLAIDGYEFGEGNPYELQLLMQLDPANSHQLSVRNQSTTMTRKVQKGSLRALLEYDYDNGGAMLATCKGCRTCRPISIGAKDCSSGCPGNYCTIG